MKRSHPILEPNEPWEKFGGVPNVIFSDAMIEYKDEYYIYYGGADTCIGLATISKSEVINWIKGE